MTSLFNAFGLVVLAILLIPVLLNPAVWLFGGALVLLWVALWWGGRYVLELNKWKSEGERGHMANVRARARDGRRGDE